MSAGKQELPQPRIGVKSAAMSTETQETCTVVVTRNRKELLQECLGRLAQLQEPVGQILVVNNASTDGTRQMLDMEFPTLRALHLEENGGGAGGFFTGMSEAYEAGFEWIWLMDDDSMVQPESLAELFAARNRFPEGKKPSVMASKVLWTDGSLHYMNPSRVKTRDLEALYLAAELGAMPIRSSTFVSLLIHRAMIERHGLPVADYFIWGDDTEFTARVLKDEFGIMAPKSRVIHKTPTKHTALNAAPERFYYHMRNTLWMLLRSKAWLPIEKVREGATLARWTSMYLKGNGFSQSAMRAALKGLWDGLFSTPRANARPHPTT